MQHVDEVTRRAFVERYEHGFFLEPRTSTPQSKWKVYPDIIRVILWGQDHFWNNIWLAMVLEAMSLGPRYYCIIRSNHPGFAEQASYWLNFFLTKKCAFIPTLFYLLEVPLIDHLVLEKLVLQCHAILFLSMKGHIYVPLVILTFMIM